MENFRSSISSIATPAVNAAVAVVLIIIGAVVGTGQRVAVAFFPLVGNTVEQPLTVFRVQQNAAVDLAGQLQHTELAIHLHNSWP